MTSPRRLSGRTRGKRAIIADTALRLEPLFRHGGRFRLNLLSRFDLENAAIELAGGPDKEVAPHAA